MPSRGKQKTTMAKLNRESRLRERKAEKEARKEARRHAALFGPPGEVDGAEADGIHGVDSHVGARSAVPADAHARAHPRPPPRR